VEMKNTKMQRKPGKETKITQFPSQNSEECGMIRFPVEIEGWGETTEKERGKRRK